MLHKVLGLFNWWLHLADKVARTHLLAPGCHLGRYLPGSKHRPARHLAGSKHRLGRYLGCSKHPLGCPHWDPLSISLRLQLPFTTLSSAVNEVPTLRGTTWISRGAGERGVR